MNKNLIWIILIPIIAVLGLLYALNVYPFSATTNNNQSPVTSTSSTTTTPVVTTPTSSILSYDNFTINIPSNYAVDTNYKYQALGPLRNISGVKFTIPTSTASGTNLSSDSYISVEHMSLSTSSPTCDASVYLMNISKSNRQVDNDTEYSVASSSDAGAGNRYLEAVYAVTNSNPCIAIRYFIHYSAYENYPTGSIKEFNMNALLAEFDKIRRSVVVVK